MFRPNATTTSGSPTRSMQSGVLPMQVAQQTGIDINSIMNMMLMMMMLIIPMKMMGGMFSEEKKPALASAKK